MRKLTRSKACGGIARIAALGAGIVLLAGCATGYSFVQPDVAGSGGYYTGAGSYYGQGYYDYYGTGPYYPGTGGFGYYNGTWPYSYPFGWYGGYYGNYGYWPQFTFGIGISNVWNFPGYWGPWYSTGFPIWSCAGPGCGYWRHHRGYHGRYHHRGWDSSPQRWLDRDHPRGARRIGRDRTPPVEPLSLPARHPVAGFANLPSLESSGFAQHDFVRAPIRRPLETGFHETSVGPAYVQRAPAEPAFVNRPMTPVPMAMPHAVQPMARPLFRSSPMPAAPVIAPPARPAHATRTEIP